MHVEPLDLGKLKVFPLAERKSLTRADEIVIDPESSPKACSDKLMPLIQEAAANIAAARKRLSLIHI